MSGSPFSYHSKPDNNCPVCFNLFRVIAHKINDYCFTFPSPIVLQRLSWHIKKNQNINRLKDKSALQNNLRPFFPSYQKRMIVLITIKNLQIKMYKRISKTNQWSKYKVKTSFKMMYTSIMNQRQNFVRNKNKNASNLLLNLKQLKM
jgi:hypothetical protein